MPTEGCMADNANPPEKTPDSIPDRPPNQPDREASIDRAPRPILVGGLGLSGLLAVWAGLGGAAETGDGFGTLGLTAIGLGAWWWRRRRSAPPAAPAELLSDDREGAMQAIGRLSVAIERLELEFARSDRDDLRDDRPTAADRAIAPEIARLAADRDALTAALDRDTIRVAVVGAPLVGKSAIVRELAAARSRTDAAKPAAPTIAWSETDIRAMRPSADTATNASADASTDIDRHHPMLLADCVLYAIDGDLTASERERIERLVRANQTVFVAWNKSDTLRRPDRDRVLNSIRHQLADLVPAERICAIAAAPRGEVEIAPLLAMLETTAIETHPGLVWQQTQRAANLAIADARAALNILRRRRAEPLVRRYQLVAATATIANPIPSLDLLASGSIGAQLLIDLGKIYHRNLSLDRARTAFDAIAELLLKLGLVELSTQAIAGILKHNPVTFIAGSTVQGLSAAYLTHAIGESAIRYFETEEVESFEAIDRDPSTGDRIWDWARFQTILTQTMAQTRRFTFMKAWIDRVLAALARPAGSDSPALDSEGSR